MIGRFTPMGESRTLLFVLCRRLVLFSVILLVLTGCLGLSAYYPKDDAPDFVKAGNTDPRLIVTRTFGGPLSPVVRNLALRQGPLRKAEGLEAYLRVSLKPLDLILVRSRPALTRLAFPTHFTHVIVWLGDEREFATFELNGDLDRDYIRTAISERRTVFESAKDSVRLSDFSQIINTAEIAVVRMSFPGSQHSARVSRLLSFLGYPFDYNFDYGDKRRLTCLEVVDEVFPELDLPVRYTTGRFVLIPDDLARMAVNGANGLRFISYVRSNQNGGYIKGSAGEMASKLSRPGDGGDV